MGPIGLINTTEDIHKLYTQVYNEPEEKAPCIHRVQDLVTYINWWKKCKLEMNEVMNLTLKEWRLPAWASQKLCQKREALRDKEREQREEDASRQQPAGEPPALQQQLEDHSATPLPEMEQRPIIPLYDCPPLLIKDPLLGVNLFIPEEEYDPPVERPEGVSPNYPKRHPLLMPQSRTGYSGSDESSELSRMFPGALGVSEHPDDDEWEISPPSAQMVQGAGNEYTTHVVSNGGDRDPNVWAVIDLLRAAIHDPHPLSENWLVKWVNQQAQALGISPERIVAYEAHTFEAGEGISDQGTSGDSPAGTWEAEEGELPDRPAPMQKGCYTSSPGHYP
ncbi:hypothetical protein EDD17DRAFT_1512431 [Pisolithus thermaeus]|nr:hypothetical protein EDD17DRAFT_1512431 [Pisolithus thermaeus]